MRRIAVIGNAGGGKSMLCAQLGEALGIGVYQIDHIQWKPGWVHASEAEIRQKHDVWMALECWIIDGWGSWSMIEERFQIADTIIVVDHPLAWHYWWTIKRQAQCLFRLRPDGPEGCPMLPMTWQLLRMVWQVHSLLRPRLLQMVETLHESKQVIYLRSPQEVKQFQENLTPILTTS